LISKLALFSDSRDNIRTCKHFAAKKVAEKLNMLSFRGPLRAEESLFFRAFKPREIPHFVRNDNQRDFFSSLESCLGSR
jgi:hypothetical protein